MFNNLRLVEISNIVRELKKDGRVLLLEGHGKTIEFVAAERWDAQRDQPDGTFLLFELFQIRNIALPFSEVSLDIVEMATRPIIYHTPVNNLVKNGPVVASKVKFALIKEGFWNRLLFNYGRPLIFQISTAAGAVGMQTKEKFPLVAGGVREMFLGPEGEVKILNG